MRIKGYLYFIFPLEDRLSGEAIKKTLPLPHFFSMLSPIACEDWEG
jgi:hypothetical protein